MAATRKMVGKDMQPLYWPAQRLLRKAATASSNQAAMKANPPMGVMAPKVRTPEMASTYRLPEKITTPASSSAQTQAAGGFSNDAQLREHGDGQKSQRVDEVIEHGPLIDAHGVGIQPRTESVRAKGA